MTLRGSRSEMRSLLAFAVVVFVLEAFVFVARLGRELTPFALVLIPAVAALIVSASSGGAAGVRRLVGRLGVWRVRPRWYAAAVAIPVAEKVVVDLAGLLLGRTTPNLLVSAVTIAAVTVPLVVLVPGLLEELGWRGFAVQTALDDGRSVAWATLVVGSLFLLMHVPLYLPGHLYHGMPFWPLPLTLLSSSVFLTWIYLRTVECAAHRSDARRLQRHRSLDLGVGPDVGLAGSSSRPRSLRRDPDRQQPTLPATLARTP